MLYDGVVEAVGRLRSAGFVTVVVTNQPDVARGRLSVADADRFSELVQDEVGVDLVIDCRHDSVEKCGCRKPEPGMFLEARSRLELDLARSFMIGDRLVDVVAAQRAGVTAILLERWWSRRPSSDGSLVEPETGFVAVDSLDGAIDHILSTGMEGVAWPS